MLDEKDLEFVDALRSLNVPRNVAALITYLANTSEATSREIEMGTNLRQPEVTLECVHCAKITGSRNTMSN
jgi:predicted transcriptional regulator